MKSFNYTDKFYYLNYQIWHYYFYGYTATITNIKYDQVVEASIDIEAIDDGADFGEVMVDMKIYGFCI